MATMSKKTKARGYYDSKQTDKNTLPKDSGAEFDNLMTHADKELLKDIKDDEDESVVEITEDGNEINVSEIDIFLKQLGVAKYRPFEAANTTERKEKGSADLQKDDDAVKNKKAGKNSKPVNGDQNNNSQTPKAKVVVDHAHQETVRKFLETCKTRKHLLLKPGEMWREEKVHLLSSVAPDERLVNEAEKLAQKLLQDEIALYTKQRENVKRSEAHWLKTVLASGTLSDKMAALTLLVQESPLHNLASIDSLISMAGKKGRREAMMATDTLKDLFLTGLLPDDRKLKAFNQQPVMDLPKMTSGNVDARDKHLLMWHFENVLKKKYAEFIKALGEMSFDTLQSTKEKAISTIHQLLTSKPEQEATLLPMLVNKLGDPVIKSKATYLLLKLVDEHPNMKPVIVREVQQLLHRPNISQRAQYYAICYLSQLRLSPGQGELASQLIQIYFYFFQTFMKKGEIESKMMSALLTGVNRAYVYAKEKKEEIADQMELLYKIIPSVNFHTSVQALMLLHQVLDASTNASDRFYMCLYRKLADPALKNSSKQAIFMNLLFKSMKSDVVDRRIKAFVKRVLQIYSQQPPQIVCGILILLSQILKNKPGLLEVKHSSAGMWEDDDEEEKFVDLPAPKEFDLPETNGQLSDQEQSGDETGQTDKIMSHGRMDDRGEQEGKDDQGGRNKIPPGGGSSWVHRKNLASSGHSSEYDPMNRNPLYARAELDCLWELEQLTKHYHPTVRLYATTLLQGEPIEYDGDPLKDFTLIRFLDRFVYKNPKKDLDKKSSSIWQFKKEGPKGVRAIPVNSKEFLEMGEEGVPEDEQFFYRYFTEKARRKGEDASDADSDAESVGDAEFDRFLDGFEKYADRDDIGDMDLDFAWDKSKTNSQRGKKGKHEPEEEEMDESEDDEDDDEDDLDLEDDELAAEFQQEMDGIDSGEESDELRQMMLGGKGKKKRKNVDDDDYDDDLLPMMDSPPKKKKKKDKHDTTNLFASAEEFAHLLEEDTETGKISLGGTADLRNKDKAAQKQLHWESERDRWLQDKSGAGHHKKRKAKGGAKHGKPMGKKITGKKSVGKIFKANTVSGGKVGGKNFKSGGKGKGKTRKR